MTVVSAAGGYIINDIIDEAIDRINKPDKQFVGVSFSRKAAYYYYFGGLVLGFLAATWLALRTDYGYWLAFYCAANALLYAYSRWLKRLPVVGNVTVAVFTACVAWGCFLPLPAANPRFYAQYFPVAVFYTAFAFATNLWREIVKDLEDMDGDRVGGCRTLPIVAGVAAAKNATQIVALATFLGVGYFGFWLLSQHHILALVFTLSGIVLPICGIAFLLHYANNKTDFAWISRLLKLLMASGLVVLFLLL